MASLSPRAGSGDKLHSSPSEPDDSGAPFLAADSAILGDVAITLEARLGSVDMSLAELLALRAGSEVALATLLSEPVGLYLNGSLVARGEIVAVDDRFGLRIVEIARQ